MANDKLIWEIEEHTKAKHLLLERYLKAWTPILGRHCPHMIYVDGFAGPGAYAGGEPGSPIIALNTATRHQARPASMTFMFLEENTQRLSHLKAKVESEFPELTGSRDYKIFYVKSEFEKEANKLLDHAGGNMDPAFWFIDPFGYSHVSMELLKKISKNHKSEVLFHLMTSHVKRFVEDPEKDEARTRLYGDDDWKSLRKTDDFQQFRDLFIRKLKQHTHFEHFLDFQLVTKKGLRYHLVYATKNEKGFAVMKSSMWHADPMGNFTFNAKNPKTNEQWLFDTSRVPELQQILLKKFSGKTPYIEDLEKFVLHETPFVPDSHLREKTLDVLKKQKKIKVVSGATKGGYGPRCVVMFLV